MLKCDHCKKPSETVCPTTHTIIAMMTLNVSKGGPQLIGAVQQTTMPLPVTTTVYLCQQCNLELLGIELTEGPRNCQQMAQWLANGDDARQLRLAESPKGVA